MGIANILAHKEKKIYLGNLEAQRDWGYAPEYVEAMWLMLQQDKPDDYVVGTGETHSVREFVEEAFKYVGIEIVWQGKGTTERGIIKSFKQNFKRIDVNCSKQTVYCDGCHMPLYRCDKCWIVIGVGKWKEDKVIIRGN